MDDMQTFERRVAGEVIRGMGPSEPVDDAAIFTAITTTQSPKWRFQTMFSATKFLVAGAIVALFGGFLLTGVFTTEPRDGAPAAVASASASPESAPTAEASADPETSTTSDILPGVDIVTEAVQPGVYRVLSDGHRDLSDQVHELTVTPEGDVWVELGTSKNWDIVRLGDPGVSRELGKNNPWELFTVDGAPVVFDGTRARLFDGEAWVDHEPSPCDGISEGGQGGIAADGDCWGLGEGDLVRVDDDGGRVEVTAEDLGFRPDRTIGSVTVADDGTLWATVHSPGRGYQSEGLVRYDGSTWEQVPFEQPAVSLVDGSTRMGPDNTSVGPDGTVWIVELFQRQSPREGMAFVTFVVRAWDGDVWTTHGPVEVELDVTQLIAAFRVAYRLSDGAHVLDDGTVWFLDGQLVLDADGLRSQELPGGEDLVFGPDGHAWSVAENALYVITPEAVAATE